ncbi:prolyl oligopeptidase family serine peptidase [Terriglobus albidus]|uniref:Prolyl oligopeptidase family serine peptidase n=1 Tax=Terriglobus albidus TaxID=1592106 RepID=A0A5B9EGZ4_9BACT|nr:S9 family peptidase [Terriglobus albidus]QEE31089.1 prolyl oligopeptidase family serine peptidase [Terriglobus albidus]
MRLSVHSGAFLCVLSTVALAQQGRVYTDADYAAAEQRLSYNVNPLVYHQVNRVEWMKDGRFWYRDVGPEGAEFFVVDAKGAKSPAFDAKKVAASVSGLLKRPVDAARLQVSSLEEGSDGKSLEIGVQGGKFLCQKADWSCTTITAPAGGAPAARKSPEALSPDGSQAAFIRDWNLWVRDVKSGGEKQLTTDGVKDYGYATDNAGWTHSDSPILVWSPDGKKIATFQQDQRKTGDMYLVSTQMGHPKLEQWKYPLPGDKDVTMIERVLIDVPTAKVLRLKMEPDQHRSTNCDDVSCRGGSGWDDVQWGGDCKTLGFVSTSRDHKSATFRIADVETGEVRTVMNETVKTYFESGHAAVDWKYLPKSNELLWFSQRSDWGHLYLYDLKTGAVKSQVTTGEWNVYTVPKVDEEKRVIYFTGMGREKGDPYFHYFYKIGFDGKGLKLLTPETADHNITLSKDGKLFVDTFSTADTPTATVLRDGDGKQVAEIAKADISKLTGWLAPTPITVKARDGKTDLYGYLYKPVNLDPSKKYPVIDYIYPGPQTGSCGGRNFAAARGDNQSLAQLGFVVVCIDGMGTPWRSKTFQDTWYGQMGDNTLPDQVAGIKELAAKNSWMDLDRVGIWGHSGGGNATADAMFAYPDFFKVGISESGNHDNRLYEDDWGERYQGMLETSPDGKTSNYDNQSNITLAKNLKGKLLLAHGTMDDNVPPYETLMVVDALIKANKTFDLLLIPNAHHGYADASRYMMRRRWDYFVTNLMGATPPAEYKMSTKPDVF